VIVSEEIARDWLLAQPSPQVADEALCRSLTSTLGVMASLKAEGRFPNDAPAYRVVTGCEFEIADRENIPAAIAKVRQAMTPATQDQCEGWLVMLQAATARRQDSEATSAVAYALYTAELRQWPADVARAACERLARGKTGSTGPVWFPTLAEVYRECDRMGSTRRVMLSALERGAPSPQLPFPSARGRPEPSESEKEIVHRSAQEVAAALRATAEAQVRAARADLPSIAGKPDETGLTPEMRELMQRRSS